jgi:hypothetical protein
MEPMDHNWFAEVRQRLTQIEAEKAQRFHSVPLHVHPAIVGSRYWHSTDATVSESQFDYDAARFPQQYIKYLLAEDISTRAQLAARKYYHEPASRVGIENTKILVARILMLELPYLLSPQE